MPIHLKMAVLLIFGKIYQKCTWFGRYFFTSANPRYFYLLGCTICATGNNKFTINGLLKMLLCHFWYFHSSNFKVNFWRKTTIFVFFQISTKSQNSTFWQPLTVKWLLKIPLKWFPKFVKKSFFVCLAYANGRYMRYLISSALEYVLNAALWLKIEVA